MKKRIIIIFSLFIAIFFFGFVKLKASGTITMTDGAQIRTAEPAGLRFEATIGGAFEGSTIEYGFVLSRGEFTKTQMESKLASGKAIKVPCGDPDGEGKIFVTITNIPESAYSSDITAIAYVNVDGEDYFADIAVTRNITEVATAYAGLIDSDFIDAIVNCNTHMVKTTLATTNEFVLTRIVSKNYGFSDLEFLWADFINDFNKATGSSLTTASTITEFHTALATGIASNSVRTFPSSCNAVKFFSGKNLVKWGWILEFFRTYGATVHIKNQATGLLRSDRTCQSYDGHRLRHLGGSIYNLFNGTAGMIDGMAANDFTAGESAYSNVPFPSATNLSGDNVVNVGDNIDLPAAITPADGYNWSCYKVGETSYAAEDSYEVTTSEVAFVPTFTPITYSITYHENGGSAGANPTTYNVETATFALIDGTKADYDFGGWYRNSSFTGEPVTSIPKGSTGDIDLYAKWLDPVPVELDIDSYNAANKTVLNSVTPDILVIPSISAGRYNLINTSNDTLAAITFTTGVNLFTTISAALTAASENDTIYVFTGTYSEELSISKDNLTIIGADKGLTLVHSDTYTTGSSHTKLSGLVTTSASNITIQGFELNNQVKITGDKSNITIKECVITVSGTNEAIYTLASSNINSLVFDKIYVSASNNRIIYIYGTVTDLTVQNSAVLDSATGVVDFVRAGSSTESTLRGTVNIIGNYIDCTQSGFHERNAGANTYNFINNYFNDMPNAIYSKSGSTKTGVVYNVTYNTFNNCLKSDKPWDVVEIDPSPTKVVYVNYNAFANTGTRASCYAISILGTTSVNDCSNNYFKADADKVTNNAGNYTTEWSLEEATTTPNTYDPYQVVQIGGKYYIYGVNLTTPAS